MSIHFMNLATISMHSQYLDFCQYRNLPIKNSLVLPPLKSKTILPIMKLLDNLIRITTKCLYLVNIPSLWMLFVSFDTAYQKPFVL